MIPRPALVLAALLSLPLSGCGPGANAGAGQKVDRPAKLGMCVSCHGVDGIAVAPGNPHLAGQDETYLRGALNRYRSGERAHPAMQAVAGALSDADIEQLSRWFAQQPRQGMRAATGEGG